MDGCLQWPRNYETMVRVSHKQGFFFGPKFVIFSTKKLGIILFNYKLEKNLNPNLLGKISNLLRSQN
jgi:hypothetical protein